MKNDHYRVGDGYRLLPNHPFIQNFWANVFPNHNGWKVVWRDYTSMKQDVEFNNEKDAIDYCNNLKHSMAEGCTVDVDEFDDHDSDYNIYRQDDKNTNSNDAFYESREWREVRYEALKRDGAKCRCCGATAVEGKKLHVDHIKPRARSPELELDINNLQILCEDCNLGKGVRDQTDWRAR
jgi:HNH endonuclease